MIPVLIILGELYNNSVVSISVPNYNIQSNENHFISIAHKTAINYGKTK